MIDYVCGCMRALSSSLAPHGLQAQTSGNVLKFKELEVVQICDDHAVVI